MWPRCTVTPVGGTSQILIVLFSEAVVASASKNFGLYRERTGVCLVQCPEDEPLLFAGLHREDDGVEWCSIVTCEPSEWFSQYHNREPVVIRGDDWMRWLFDEDPPEDLIHPSTEGELEVFACSKPDTDHEPAPARGGLFD